MVEQRLSPGVPHPIPVLRAEHVRLYTEPPDLAKFGLDDLAAAAGEATLTPATRFAVVGDGHGGAVLLTLSDLAIPQDQTGEWHVRVRAEPVALVAHVADPVGDRGRAVLATEPLPLSGHLVFAVRPRDQDPAALMTLDLAGKPAAKPVELAKVDKGRTSAGGVVGDAVDLHTLHLTDKAGRRVGTVKVDSEIADWNLSPDGSRVVVGTERMGKPRSPTEFPHQEMVSLVFTAEGKLLGEVIGYYSGAFLPDGNLVVTASGGQPGLFIADVSSGKVTPLKLLDGPSGQSEPAWPQNLAVSPDGKRVAYVSQRNVFIVGVDGRGWTPLWNNPAREVQARPAFSPDGRCVAFINVPLNVMSGPGEVVVVDLEKHVRLPIAGTQGANSKLPLTWQP